MSTAVTACGSRFIKRVPQRGVGAFCEDAQCVYALASDSPLVFTLNNVTAALHSGKPGAERGGPGVTGGLREGQTGKDGRQGCPVWWAQPRAPRNAREKTAQVEIHPREPGYFSSWKKSVSQTCLPARLRERDESRENRPLCLAGLSPVLGPGRNAAQERGRSRPVWASRPPRCKLKVIPYDSGLCVHPH